MESAYAEVERLLQQMTGTLPANHPAHKVSEKISVLVRAYTDPGIDERLEGLKLTKSEARVMLFLLGAKGHFRHQGAISDAIYFDHAGDPPEMKIIDIFICRLRKKIRGTKWAVENAWGQGYRLVEKQPEAIAA